MSDNPVGQPEGTEPQEQEESVDVGGFLSDFEGAPAQDQIEAWKSKFGDVMCSAFSDTELYVWRPLSRSEYLQIQQETMMAAQAGAQIGEAEVELRVVSMCMLWASEPGKKALDTKGGSVSSLNEQMMLASNFMPSQMAAQLVIKL